MWPLVAAANGSVVSYETQRAGPYEVRLGTIPEFPTVGSLHLSITVSAILPDDTVPVLDATVTVTGSGPNSTAAELGPVSLRSNPFNLAFYETNVEVDRIGVWTFAVNVSADQGEASTSFDVTVVEANTFAGIATLAFLLVLLVIIGLAFRSYLKKRPRPTHT